MSLCFIVVVVFLFPESSDFHLTIECSMYCFNFTGVMSHSYKCVPLQLQI